MEQNFKFIAEGSQPVFTGYHYYTEALQLMVDQRNALIQDDWAALKKLCDQGLGLVAQVYKEILRESGQTVGIAKGVNDKIKELILTYANDEDKRAVFFTNVKAKLLELDPNTDQEILDSIDKMIDGDVEGNPYLDFLENHSQPGKSTRDSIVPVMKATAALAVRSMMGLTHYNFNRHNETVSKIDFSSFTKELMDQLKPEVIEFQNELEVRIKNIYLDIIARKSPIVASESLISWVEKALPRFGRIQAAIRKLALTLKAQDKGTAAEKVGRLGAVAGDVTRMVFTAKAAAYYLAFQSTLDDKDAKVKKLLNKADHIAFDTQFPNGKDVEVAKVDQLEDGAYVEVRGFVDSIETGRDSDSKLITQVTLYDPSSDSNVIAAGIYVHLRHLGLIEGAYCQLSGYWKTASGVNYGHPAIEIEQLAVNELAKTSWKVAFFDLADKFIERWPGGLNIQFGMSPHLSAAEEDIDPIPGAGELIYKKLIS